ncbi:hypothetical protein [Terrisporobacter mayombei]|uniref:Uncharacterized protein n=1 Tax=Terrisporobacter mayombei TaxID=1541 RepID=A0ABY9PYT3_9FIRM|nr:hypothetical protein [Terrisporobacter mayombei]MCC3868272.1 hypothetical protein [Terrisporobacter mayombei]WMT80413.1 hypothetical protein TEMA_07290 [Terrisporobacter mayombei]
MKKKIKYKIAIPTVIVLVLLSYIFLTPIGTLRFAVFRQAFTSYETTLKGRVDLLYLTINLNVDYESCWRPPEAVIEGDQTVYDLIDYPFEPLTQMPRDSWVITKHDIFYWGEYYLV